MFASEIKSLNVAWASFRNDKSTGTLFLLLTTVENNSSQKVFVSMEFLFDRHSLLLIRSDPESLFFSLQNK